LLDVQYKSASVSTPEIRGQLLFKTGENIIDGRRLFDIINFNYLLR